MPFAKTSLLKTATTFLPFWFYIILYKFGAGIHYSMVAVLGAQVLPLWSVGFCIGFGSLIQLALDIPAGFLLERYGYIRMLRLTTVCFLLAGAVLLVGLTPITFLLSVIFSAFGWLFFTPGIAAYLLAHGPVSIIGRLFGVQRAAEGFGVGLALLGLPFFVALPAPALGLVIMYPLLGALAALAIGERYNMPTFLPKTARVKRHAIQAGLKEIVAAFRRLHPVGTIMGMYMLSVAGFYGVIWFVLPLLINQGIVPATLSAGMTVLEFAVIITGFTIARLADHRNKKSTLAVGLVAVALLSLLFGKIFAPVFILLCLLLSSSDEMVRITLWAWLDAKAAGGRHHGVITGTVTFLEDLGWMIGPAAAGLLYAALGPIMTLHIGAVLLALSAVCCIFLVIPAKNP